MLKPKKSHNATTLIDEQGNKVQGQNVPTKFVDYFTSIAENLTSQLQNSSSNPADYLINRNPNTFAYSPTSSAKNVSDVINDLKDNGVGVYRISNSVLKYVSNELSPTLALIIDICINQGYFPSELKKGCITPIHKSGNKNTVNNYRPVCSLLPLNKNTII